MKKNQAKSNICQIILAIIMALCTFILSLYVTFMPNALNRQIYINHFTGSESAIDSNLSQETLNMLIDRILTYSYGSSNDLQISITTLDGTTKDAFISDEIMHYYDVQALFIKGRLLVAICAVIFLGCLAYFIIKRDAIKRSSILAGLLTIVGLTVASAVLLIVAASDFDNAFITFHHIFFHNDYWLLPWDSVSIITMPESAFYEVAIRTLIEFVIVLAVECTLLIVFYKKKSHKKRQQLS